MTSVEELYSDIQDFVKLVCPKKVTSLESRSDLELLDSIIADWNNLARVVKVDTLSSDTMNHLIKTCIAERGKTHPLKDRICKAIKEFNQLYYSEVVIEARSHQYGLVHHDLLSAISRLESSLKDSTEREYFAEAKACIGHGLYRSFVVMSWNIVMYRLYKRIEAGGFAEFLNAYAQAYPGSKKPSLSCLEDFFDISDAQVIETSANKSIQPHIIDKHQKEILARNLRVRNMSAHVSTSFIPREATVLGYVQEILDSFLSRT